MTISFFNDDKLWKHGVITESSSTQEKINVEVQEVQIADPYNSAELAAVNVDTSVALPDVGMRVKTLSGGDIRKAYSNHRDYSKILVDDGATYTDKIDPTLGVARFGLQSVETDSYQLIFSNYNFESWGTANSTILTGYEDPFGGTNARLLRATNPAGDYGHYITKSNGVYYKYASQTARISIYAKAGTCDWIRIYAVVTGAPYLYFNVAEGYTGSSLGGAWGDVEDVGNGWFKCNMYTNNANTGDRTIQIGAMKTDGDAAFVCADPTEDAVYLYHETSSTLHNVERYKARNNYWSMTDYQHVTNADNSEHSQHLHNNGSVLMKACTYDAYVPITGVVGKRISVSVRNESTKAWGSYVTVATVGKTDNSKEIDPSPCMITIPNVGTIIYFFGFDPDAFVLQYKPQKIFSYITKDNGVSWEPYNEIIIEPYYSGTYSPGQPYAYHKIAQLKAAYHDNKIVIGMMLYGADTPTYKSTTEPFGKTMNLMYSRDLGKTFTTVKENFITKVFAYSFSESSTIYGYVESGSTTRVQLPANFGLGFEASSGKFALVMRGAGIVNSTVINPLLRDNLENINKWFFFYNEDDDLNKWESSVVSGDCYRPIDEFDVDRLDTDYTTKIYGTSTTPYEYTPYCLASNTTTSASYVQGEAHDGVHLIYKKDPDPTMSRTIGVRVKLSSTYYTGVNMGFCFCRQDDNNYYAVIVSGSSSSQRTIYLKKVVAGVEQPTLASATVYWFSYQSDTGLDPMTSWRDVEVKFAGASTIYVYLDGKQLFSYSDTSFYEGAIGLISNSNASLPGGADYRQGYKEFGLLTSNTDRVMLGNFQPVSNVFQVYNTDKQKVDEGIEIVNDENNQTWLIAEVTAVDEIPYTDSTEYNSSIVVQKFRFEKSVKRTDGKFLGRESYQVKFADEKDFYQNAGYFVNPLDWGVINGWYKDNTYRYAAKLVGAAWYDDAPALLTAAQNSPPTVGLLTRGTYSNRTISAVLNAHWTRFNIPGTPADPGAPSGWDYHPGVSYTYGNDYVQFRTPGVTTDGGFTKKYTHTTGLMTYSETSYSDPIANFNFYKRGAIFYLKHRASTTNVNGTYRIFTTYVPAYVPGTGMRAILFRLCVSYSTTGAGYFYVQHYNGSDWVTLDQTLATFDISLGGTDWWETIFYLVPVELTSSSTNPLLYGYFKKESEDVWQTLFPSQLLNRYTMAPQTADTASYIQFGVFDTGAVDYKSHEFKDVAYADTCYYDPYKIPVIGETMNSGIPIKSPEALDVAVSGGKTVTDDEWLITDVKDRAFDSKNILDNRASVIWKSDDDSESKSIIIDAGQNLYFDTIILYNTNCMQIDVDYNTVNSFPNSKLAYPMADNEVYISSATVEGEYLLSSATEYTKDKFAGKMMMFWGSSPSQAYLYRILKNDGKYFTLDMPRGLPTWNPTGSVSAFTVSDRIAVKYPSVNVGRYFKLIFRQDALGSTTRLMTPEGYFKLGYISIGMLNNFQYNPEYPEQFKYGPITKFEDFQTGLVRGKNLGPMATTRTLNFEAVDATPRQFADQIRRTWSNRVMPVTYIPNINETLFSSVYYKTHDLMACYQPPSITMTRAHGDLINVSLELKENIR